MKFLTVTYRTNNKYINAEARVYIEKDINLTIADDIKYFNEINVTVYAYSIREATKAEIEAYLNEYEKDDLIYIICNLMNI